MHGYHIYKDVWPNPFRSEVVQCEHEERNVYNPFAMSFKKTGTGTMSHVSCMISCICTLFLSIIEATVTGPLIYSADLRERWC